MLTTARTRALRICSFAVMAVTVSLLMGQGCPSTDGQFTAYAGPDFTIQPSARLMLQASVSGGSGVYTYSWSPSTGLDKTDVLQPIFTAGAEGTVTFTLTVTDSSGATASDSVRITVGTQSGGSDGDNNTSGLLKANAGPDKFTGISSPVVLEGSASGGVAPYTYLWTPLTSLSSATQAQPVYTPSVSGSVSYTLTVTDALGATASDSVTVNIAQAASISTLIWGADYAGGGYQVLATFNQQLSATSAANVANYRINGSIHPTSAKLGADGRTVTLVFNERLSSFAKLDVGVGGGLRDALGGVVVPATDQAINSNLEDIDQPIVNARIWGNNQSSYTVFVEYSEAMDGTSAEDVHSYLLEGSTNAGGKVSVQPTRAVLDSSGKVVTLTFENSAEGFGQADLLKISGEVRDVNLQKNASVDWEWIDVNLSDTAGPAAPALSRAWGVNQTNYTVNVTFSEVMDKISAENLASYELGSINPTKALLDSSGRTVVLTFETTVGGLNLSDTLKINQTVTDINGQPTTTVDPTAVSVNLVDMAGPSLSAQTGRVWAGNQTSYAVVLTFSEAMDKASATNPANYSLAAAGGATNISPDSATLDAAGRIVTLSFPTPVTGGLNSTDLLTVSAQVKDVNGRANISTMPAGINANPTDLAPPVALSRTWGASTSSYQVRVEFSEVMDRLTTTRLASYMLHGSGGLNKQQPSSVALEPAGRIVTLTFDSTGTTSGGFSYDDVLEIMTTVTDINGRGVTSSRAAMAKNTADTTGPGIVRATLFEQQLTYPSDPDEEPVFRYWIDLVFDEGLDKFSAETALYTFAGAGVTTTTVQSDGRTVRLVLDATAPDAIDPSLMTLTVPNTVLDINRNAAAGGDVTVQLPLAVDTGSFAVMSLGDTLTFSPVVTGGKGPYTASWTPAMEELVTAEDLEPDFTPTAQGDYIFTVTVTDLEGRTASDTLTVYVVR